MFTLLAQRLNSRSVTQQSYRFLRARWERGYLKDLYHRRQLLGADPLLSRSSQPNWNYTAEIAAFTNRIGAVSVEKSDVLKALTSSSYKSRADFEAENQDSKSILDDNSELIQRGKDKVFHVLRPFLRANMPNAPEELIEAVVNQITSDTVLSNIGMHLGLESLVRTVEHPPSQETVANSVLSLAAVMDKNHVYKFSVDFIIPQLIDVDFVEVFPLADPLSVLSDILKRDGAKAIEPRLLRSIGECSAQPVYVVGIYKDKQELVGQSAGETVSIAIDMAAREGLLRHWGLTADRLFFFGDDADKVHLDDFLKKNHQLREICEPQTDCSLKAFSDEEPLNIVEMALKYKNEVEDVVGRSYTKRLRHKFSRGSLLKRSHRYLVKPKVYTVA